MTITGPVPAPVGTGATMVMSFQLVGVVDTLLNETVFEPWLVPKPEPFIVTEVPTAPDVGDSVVTTGVTVKVTPLLATPPTLTTTLPVVAAAGTGTAMLPVFQLVGVAAAPLKVTVLDPWLEPKFEPLIVTEAPTAPLVGDKLLIDGVLPNACPTKNNVTAETQID